MKQQDDIKYDIAIIGDGLSGQAVALALAAAGASVWLGGSAGRQRGDDRRAMALAPSSVAMLRQLGVCEKLPAKLAPLRQMHIADGSALHRQAATSMSVRACDKLLAGSLYFTTPEESSSSALAYISSNRDLSLALAAGVEEAENITWDTTANVTDLNLATPDTPDASAPCCLTLADGSKINAALAVACDGRASPMRKKMSIDTTTHAYTQTALIGNLTHTKPHRDTAHQFFHAAGTLATLPFGVRESALIWVVRPSRAEALQAASDAQFIDALSDQLGGVLGQIKTITARAHYPLGLSLARHYTSAHFALAGEAAHLIHPLAGQGYNLTLRDAACLADAFYEARRLGLGIGTASMLASYGQVRRLDALAMAATTHALNMVFTRNPDRPDLFAPFRRAAFSVANVLPGLAKTARLAADIGVHGFSPMTAQAPSLSPRLLRGQGYIPFT